MLDIKITDGTGTKSKASVSEDGFLRVESRDYYVWENKVIYFTNSEYGSNLAVNATANGTPENIHNGLDDVYWTGVNIVGNKADFNNDDVAHTDTNSIKFDGATNDIFELQYPTGTFTVSAGYTGFDGWIYLNDLKTPSTDRIDVYGYNSNTGLQVGVKINLLDYINKSTIKTWQSFSVPLADMGLTDADITALRFQVIEADKVKFYLDDLIFSAPGTAVGVQVYTISAEKNKTMEVNSILFNIVSNDDSTLANASMPELSYNTLLGKTLTNGILYRRIQDGETRSSWTPKNIFDFLERPNVEIQSLYGTASSKSISIKWNFFEPNVLNYRTRDILTITISDNLSQFLKFSVVASARIRNEEVYRTLTQVTG